jgi:acyl carrier protein
MGPLSAAWDGLLVALSPTMLSAECSAVPCRGDCVTLEVFGTADRRKRLTVVDVETQVRAELVDFIVTNFLFGDATRTPQDDDSLVEGGIIDSTGVMELIEFLESHFGIEVSERDTVPSNLDTVANLTRFVGRMQAGAEPEAPEAEGRRMG